MEDLSRQGQELASCQQYRTLLAVAEAIISHRDLRALFHELADRLHQVVRFDYLILVLHDAASNTMRRHILETSEPSPIQGAPTALPVEDGPAGWVWQTQQPMIVSNVAEETRWPRFLELMKQIGMHSICDLPLTTARQRLGALAFLSRQAASYDSADVDFLQLVANQVAVAERPLFYCSKLEAAGADVGEYSNQEGRFMPSSFERVVVTGIRCHPIRGSADHGSLTKCSLSNATRPTQLRGRRNRGRERHPGG